MNVSWNNHLLEALNKNIYGNVTQRSTKPHLTFANTCYIYVLSQLASAEEWITGDFKGNLGEILIRYIYYLLLIIFTISMRKSY